MKMLNMRDERAAMDRATDYAENDPYYEGKELTQRERALMMLAIRAYTRPDLFPAFNGPSIDS